LRNPDLDDPLFAWGQQLVATRGKRIAVVAVARRLAGILWAMWRSRTVYDPAHLARQSALGHERHAQTLEFQVDRLRKAERKLTQRRRRVERAQAGAPGNRAAGAGHRRTAMPAGY
jgi:hypothetical protein